VEDKTEYKDRQIDGWENQLAVFSLKFYFEKDTFLPVKLKLGRKEGSVYCFGSCYLLPNTR
jgi:hypothetical protein